jgi:ssDNA-binding replication factor A large subunit
MVYLFGVLIKDIKPRSTLDEITFKIVRKITDKVVISKYSSKALRVQEFKICDSTGESELVLWEDDCDKVTPEDMVRITNGYAKPFGNTFKVTPGKYGNMEII